MMNSTIFEKIGNHVKSSFSKIYHASLLDSIKEFTPIHIKLGLLKNLLNQWIEMAMDLMVPASVIFYQICFQNNSWNFLRNRNLEANK